MNIKGILLGLLSINYANASAFSPLKPSIAEEYTKKLNTLRGSVGASNMQMLHYDYDAQHKLDAIIYEHGPRWMFENYTGVLPAGGPIRQNLNGYYLPPEIGIAPVFEIGWHDTCSKLGQNCLNVNFNFRARQSHCFVYDKCNTTVYDRYRSCESNQTEKGPSQPCSYAFDYYMIWLTSNANKIACAVLEVPGWKPPRPQLNSYWCFTNGVAPSNDQPFKKGPACSECEPKQKCVNRLCV